MASMKVTDALNGVRRLTRGRARFVAAYRLPGSELLRIGGGDLLPTPVVPSLPTSSVDRDLGLCGDTLALPPANVRLLRDVRLFVGENLVRTTDGAVVVNDPGSARLGRPARNSSGQTVVRHEGTAALYGAPVGGEFEALVCDVAPIVLLQHAVLRRVAPITVMHTQSTTMLERFLLRGAMNSQVRCKDLPAGTVVEAEVTAFPAPVTREGAGAVPRWFRRWVDLRASSVQAEPAARELVVTHGPGDPLVVRPELMAPALEAGFTHVDTLTGQVEGDGTLDEDQLVATIAQAVTVLGASDSALASTLLCRRANVYQLATQDTISPRVAQLAASKALPYRLLRPADLPEALSEG